MSLGSQTNRIGITSRGGAAVHRRRRRRSIVIVLGVCALAAAWLFWPTGDTDSVAGRRVDTTPAGSSAAATGSAAGAAATRTAPTLPTLTATTPRPAAAPALPTTSTSGPTGRPAVAAAPATPNPLSETRGGGGGAGSDAAAAAGITEAIEDAVAAVPAPEPFTISGDAKAMYDRADRLISEGDTIEARNVLSQVLLSENAELSTSDATLIRERLADLNQTLIFSPELFEGDPICKPYEVDTLLSRIGVRHRVPWQLLEVINDIKAQRVQAGQTIKVLQGPLHARVIKHQFAMDVFAVGVDGAPVFVHTFPVGLGKDDKTPVGRWKVTAGKKVANPNWRDEENGEFFESNNPLNPIGEYWIPIEGTETKTKGKKGFGIHGTIEPSSIGKEASRGCIRLGDADIELVFYLLTDHSQSSTVIIKP